MSVLLVPTYVQISLGPFLNIFDHTFGKTATGLHIKAEEEEEEGANIC